MRVKYAARGLDRRYRTRAFGEILSEVNDPFCHYAVLEGSSLLQDRVFLSEATRKCSELYQIFGGWPLCELAGELRTRGSEGFVTSRESGKPLLLIEKPVMPSKTCVNRLKREMKEFISEPPPQIPELYVNEANILGRLRMSMQGRGASFVRPPSIGCSWITVASGGRGAGMLRSSLHHCKHCSMCFGKDVFKY